METQEVVSEEKTTEGEVKDNQEISFTPEVLDGLIESDDLVRRWFTQRTDSRVSKAIQNHDVKVREKIRQEEENRIREELMPKETPEQKRLLKVEQEMAQTKMQARRQELINFAMKEANNLELSSIGDQIDYFVHDSEEAIKAHLEWLKEREKFSFEKGRNSFLKENSYTPKAGGEDEKLPFANIDEYKRYLSKHGAEKYDRNMFMKLQEKQNRR